MKNILLSLLLAFPLLSGCHSPYYTIEPFEAWAVDAESGEPIEGAVVVATWALFEDGLHGHHFREMVEVKETVTDKNGRFAFPGFKFYNPKLHDLMEDPKIIIFKSGYEYVRKSNGCGMGAVGDCRWATRIAVVAGQKVKMKKLDYSRTPKVARPEKGMERSLYSGLTTEMSYVQSSGRAKDIPLFVASIRQEIARLNQEGYSHHDGLPRFR